MWKIDNVFYVSLLEENILRKGQVHELGNNLPEPGNDFETENNKKY